MRIVVPWLGALAVFVALFPVICVSDEDGPTSCRSAFLPLPWGESADTWGWVAAFAGTVAAFLLLRWLIPRPDHKPPTQ